MIKIQLRNAHVTSINVLKTVLRIELAFSDFLVLHAVCKLCILQGRFHHTCTRYITLTMYQNLCRVFTTCLSMIYKENLRYDCLA